MSALKMMPMDWLWLVVLSTMWGGSFIFIELALSSYPPLTLVALRLALAAAVLAIGLALTRSLPPFDRPTWRMFFVMGLLNNAVPFTLFAWGQTQIGAGLASIFNALTPLFTIAIAHVATADEKITLTKLAAVALGLVGVAVLLGGEAFGEAPVVAAGLACLGGALSYAISGVYARKAFARGLTPTQASMGQLAASLVLMAPLALAIERPWTMGSPEVTATLALVGLALISTALAYIIFFHVLARAGATNVLLVTFLQPVSAVAMGIAFLGEQLSGSEAAGMAIILVSLVIADGRWARVAR
jgi:drug/metabolite transporter (DMT)-like permease